MHSILLMFMIAAAYTYSQVFAEDVYVAELMVESNTTLDAQFILTLLNGTSSLWVTGAGGTNYTVTLTNSLVAECLVIGDETSCNCSTGYAWSNEVCYKYNCCRETTCRQSVSMVTPLCVDKVEVVINGSIYTGTSIRWDASKGQTVKNSFETLNGLQTVNVTGPRASDPTIIEFNSAVSVRVDTSKLQEVITSLTAALGAGVQIFVDTLGMVNIEVPTTSVCYMSTPELKCTFEEATGSAAWYMSRQEKRFELNNGIVVQLNSICATTDYKSCIAVTLKNLTGIWEGTYECGFTNGTIRHTAKADLNVALLPDVITMEVQPLIVDCSKGEQQSAYITATVLRSKENYTVVWTPTTKNNKSSINGPNIVYSTEAAVICDSKEATVSVTFQNRKGQGKTATVPIPKLLVVDTSCKAEDVDGQRWPQTPKGVTVFNRTCSPGRVGFISRTCNGPDWQKVYTECIDQQLNNVKNAAEDFLKGLGATQEVAMDIFEGLKNSSTSRSDANSIADIGASINILNTMASASQTVVIKEEVLPNFVKAASNMLNSTWGEVNETVRHNMSAKYLESMEGLVKNIKINNSKDFQSPNLDLKFCTSSDCNVSVFDINVNLNKTSGIMKTVGVKNLMNKLKNNFPRSELNPLLLSATLENGSDSTIVIKMDFPNDKPQKNNESFCVFWNTTLNEWSKEGCTLNKTDGNRSVCVCNHLTSFSVLMSKTDVSTPELDFITYVGLGVSICSLLIFLLIEALVWSAVVKSNLSHFRHTCVVNIAVFRLLADCSFLASSFPDKLSESMCLAFTVCKHLLYLAMFCWMLCLSIMLVHQLIFVFSPLRKRVFMFLSSIVGYVCPIIIVGCSYVYSKYTKREYYDKTKCWLVYEGILKGSLHAFLLPAGVIILTNLFSMVVVIVTLMKSSVPDSSKTDDKETAKSILKVVVFLTPVFGITWVIGYFVFTLEPSHELHFFVSYSFTILNSFQGLFIFLTACFAEQKVRDELIRMITGKSKGNSDSTKNLTSTAYTKDK
ncbi:adhesion G-protein coupled receptor F2 [Parambassis ranga]|uniref:Adhesion G-protein coupled receptor F2 n=1 Tax=Parambassis ranga TaxID=210632 RepID=A0A6P7HEN6_9TELE|nr:adhesion G-protein coupled receptor F2-like [Parambassis ranga]